MALEQRLKQIEIRLKKQPRVPHYEAKYVDLFDFPKDTVIGALSTIKDAGGYQLMFKPELVAIASENEISALNTLTPDPFYEMMVTQRLEGR